MNSFTRNFHSDIFVFWTIWKEKLKKRMTNFWKEFSEFEIIFENLKTPTRNLKKSKSENYVELAFTDNKLNLQNLTRKIEKTNLEDWFLLNYMHLWNDTKKMKNYSNSTKKWERKITLMIHGWVAWLQFSSFRRHFVNCVQLISHLSVSQTATFPDSVCGSSRNKMHNMWKKIQVFNCLI